MLDSILATFAYFGIAAVLLLAGFVVLDLLTPGKLYRAVFVDHHVNAADCPGSGAGYRHRALF